MTILDLFKKINNGEFDEDIEVLWTPNENPNKKIKLIIEPFERNSNECIHYDTGENWFENAMFDFNDKIEIIEKASDEE